MVKLLLEKGAECKCKYGRTALSYASYKGNEKVVKLILDKGAEVDSKCKYGRTPLSYAAWGGNTAVIKLLLDRGAKLNCEYEYGETSPSDSVPMMSEAGVEHLLAPYIVDLYELDNQGSMPLHCAVLGEKEEAVIFLLEQDKIDSNIRNDYGNTPLHFAIFKGNERIAELLLKQNNIDPNAMNEYGTALRSTVWIQCAACTWCQSDLHADRLSTIVE